MSNYQTGATGPAPSDKGLAVRSLRNAAYWIGEAMEAYCKAYHLAEIPASHPLLAALQDLSDADQELAAIANVAHDPGLFQQIRPETLRIINFRQVHPEETP
jgi:hypothetical protein